MGFTVSGWAVIGVLRATKREWGSGTVAELVSQMSGESSSIFGAPLHASSTYPDSCLTELMAVAEQNKGKGAVAAMGRGTGALAVNEVFPIYQQMVSIERFLKSFPRLWEKMTQGAGRFDIVEMQEDGAIVRLVDYPEMPEPWCRFLGGWIGGAVQNVSNKEEVDVRERACPRNGGPCHEYQLTWSQ